MLATRNKANLWNVVSTIEEGKTLTIILSLNSNKLKSDDYHDSENVYYYYIIIIMLLLLVVSISQYAVNFDPVKINGY